MEPQPLVSPPTSEPTPESARGPKRGLSLSKVLPSERLALDRQIDALRAFAAVSESNGGKPVTNEKAGEITKMAAATIVVTNAFFSDVGLLSRADGGGFNVSAEAVAFHRAMSNGIRPETAPEKLRPVFERQWFTQLIVPRLSMGPQDAAVIQGAIAEECNATKEHLPRIDLMLAYLCYVGIISREGNTLRLMNSAPKREEEIPLKTKTPSEDEIPEGLEKYYITLDPAKKRRVIIMAPPTVTAKELKRIQDWLAVQLNITDVSTDPKDY